MQVWSRGLKHVETLTQAFPLPFLTAGFSGTWECEDMTLLKKKKKKKKQRRKKISATADLKLTAL